jgi:CBS domain-containing protein
VAPATAHSGAGEVARFLAAQRPFDSLAPHELGELVSQTELEFIAAGGVILSEDGGPVTFLRVIHSGAVDITHNSVLLDLLGPGDTFGHSAMLSGLPPGFQASAAEDTLCYRVPVAVARPLLDRAVRREVRVGAHEPSHLPVAELIRMPTVLCRPDDSVAEVALRMTEAAASAAVVDLGDRGIGLVTDRDLRTRVLAAELPVHTRVGDVMTIPVFTVAPDRLGGEVLFELLQRDFHHAPIVADSGRLVGVVTDGDLFAVQPRSWFGTRRAIARAQDADALQRLAAGMRTIALDLHASSLRATELARVLSALTDAIVSRALELALCPDSPPPAGLVWAALGSHARRELTPASTPRGVLLFTEQPNAAALEQALATLRACGVAAAGIFPAGGASGTAGTAAAVAVDLADDVALELLVDRRAVWGTPEQPLPLVSGVHRDALLAQLRARALGHSPPTGFQPGAVLGRDGSRAERLDLRAAAIAPIVDLARWGAFAAGDCEGSTLQRLRAAASEGTLTEGEAGTLTDAFGMVFELLVGHHVQQIANGEPTSDALDLAALSPLVRTQLRDVFHALGAIQRRHGP